MGEALGRQGSSSGSRSHPAGSQRRAEWGGYSAQAHTCGFGKSPQSLETPPPPHPKTQTNHPAPQKPGEGCFCPRWAYGLHSTGRTTGGTVGSSVVFCGLRPTCFFRGTQGRGAGRGGAVLAKSSPARKRPSVCHSCQPQALSTQPSQPGPLGDSLTALRGLAGPGPPLPPGLTTANP